MFKKKEIKELAEPKAKPAAATIIESGQNTDIYSRNSYYDM